MMKSFKSKIAFFILSALSLSASAALVSSTGYIQNLRTEGNNGWIGLPNNLQYTTTCLSRVWVDITTPAGRAAYATAMLAYSTKQTVVIRMYEESTRIYSECNLYDLYVSP